ncbi:MAG: hypothetical protein N3G21_05010, partial [Candidatus Hydrogenedentes bacterium]|nr:hypothetical protein [Candidatus Hydrogenedentota bacterium]
MGNYLHPAHVANVVTSFCLLWSGVILTLFWFLESNQPLRWLFFYFTIIITAIPTIIHHIIPENLSWTSLDIMSNVLLVVALELALVGDYFTQKVRMFFLWLFGTLNLLAIAYLFSI